MTGLLAELSSKKLLEQIDCLVYQANKLSEAWNQRLTFKNLALAERYLKGELRIHIHGRRMMHRGFGNPEEFCAIFQRELPITGTQGDKYRLNAHFGAGIAQPDREIDNHVSIGTAYEYRKLVFLGDAKSIEAPKAIVPSLV